MSLLLTHEILDPSKARSLESANSAHGAESAKGATRSQPSAAPSLARSVIDRLTVHFHLNASRVDTLARKRLPRLASPSGPLPALGQTSGSASGWRGVGALGEKRTGPHIEWR